MRLPRAALAPAAAVLLLLPLAGCAKDASGDDTDRGAPPKAQVTDHPGFPATRTPETVTATQATDTPATGTPATGTGDDGQAPGTADLAHCPTSAPRPPDPQWTFDGTTGSVAVTPATDSTAPLIQVTTPFSVAATTVRTIAAGDGRQAGVSDTVVVCYEGVNGTTGRTFDSSYRRGEPATFPVSGVVPGFKQALVGQQAGARVAVAIPPWDGYGATGNPGAAIGGTDTLVFEIHVLQVLAG